MRARHEGITAVMMLTSFWLGCASGEDVAPAPHGGEVVATCRFVDTNGSHRVLGGVPKEVTAKIAALSGRAVVSPLDRVAAVVEQASSMPPTQRVSLTIDLAPVGAGATQEDSIHRDCLRLEQRIADSGAQHGLLRAWLEERGAKGIQMTWLNQMRANVPASAVARLLLLPDVIGLSLSTSFEPDDVSDTTSSVAEAGAFRTTSSPTVAYDGLLSRSATLLEYMLDERMDGRTGNRLNGENPIRIGIFEAAMLNHEHAGWKDCAASTCRSRLIARKDCSEFPCVETTAAPDPDDPHATLVSYIAAGSIEEGQDPAYPGEHTDDQIARSGHLPEAQVYFYTGRDSDSISNAIHQAVLDGVDVLNLSLRWGKSCDGTFDVSGINLALKTARTYGVLVTACGGNSGADGCTVWYPAVRADTLAVNGLRTRGSRDDYGDLPLSSHASRGDVPIRVYTGWPGWSPAVDLSAPGTLRLFAAHQGATGYASKSASGCSVATPVVSAAAGALKGAMYAMGYPTNCAELLMVNMLLMGDGWDPVTGHRQSGLSKLSGTGRIRMHWKDELVQPAGWDMHAFRIHDGETHAFSVGAPGPESPRIQQWKWAALWFEDDFQNVADVDFFVYDTCPPGGGEVLVTADLGFGLRMRVTLLQPDIGGRCLEMRVVGTAVPAEGRDVWMADYFHSGDPSIH
jgi:Subtilase family